MIINPVNNQQACRKCRTMFNHFLVVFLSLLLPSVHSCTFSIPEVIVQVYQPRGLRVKIPHQAGIQLFAFHGSVNRRLPYLNVGSLYNDVWEPTGNWWVYDNTKVQIRIGDCLHYWYNVIHEKKIWRKYDQEYCVNELIRGQMPDLITNADQARDEEEKGGGGGGGGGEAEEINLECELAKNKTRICADIVYKLTQQFVNVSSELKTLRERNELLSEIIKQRPTYKTLTMKGRISRDDDPISVVKFVLNEKLDLQPDIISAIRNDDQSITFQLSDLADVLNILNEAKVKLAKATSVSITI